jgi:hypothetical protein
MELLKNQLNKKSDFLLVFLISVISLFLLRNIFHFGIYTAHDIWHNLARLNYYFEAIKDGQFPPYFLGNLAFGFGYPLFVFSYHLPWILGSILMFLGLSDVSAIKILFFFGFFLSGVFMYFLAFEISKNKFLSLISSILYLVAPYRFFIIYVSAAVGVSLAFIFAPLVILGMLKIYNYVSESSKNKSKSEIFFISGVLILTIGLFGIALSHFPTLIILSPLFLILFLYLLFSCSKKIYFFKLVFISIFLSFGISSFYLVPAIYYKNFILGLPDIFSMGFVTLKQLVYSKWGFGIIVHSSSENPFSFQIGIAQWLIFLASILFLVLNWKIKKDRNLILLLVFCFLLNIFFSTTFSKFIWNNVFSHTGVDFPFRFIFPNVFLASLLFVYIAKNLKGKAFYFIWVFIILAAFYTNRNHLRPNMFLLEQEFRPFVEGEYTTSSYNEYFPKTADFSLAKKETADNILKENNMELIFENSKKSVYKISLSEDKEIVLPKYYYPFVRVKINGKPSNATIGKGGLIKIPAEKNTQEIEVYSKRTALMNISLTLSVLSLFVFFLLVWKNIQGKRYEN